MRARKTGGINFAVLQIGGHSGEDIRDNSIVCSIEPPWVAAIQTVDGHGVLF